MFLFSKFSDASAGMSDRAANVSDAFAVLSDRAAKLSYASAVMSGRAAKLSDASNGLGDKVAKISDASAGISDKAAKLSGPVARLSGGICRVFPAMAGVRNSHEVQRRRKPGSRISVGEYPCGRPVCGWTDVMCTYNRLTCCRGDYKGVLLPGCDLGAQ